ncbi:MAG: adenosylcobinamide-GDP ribazoletransferase [Brachymonas sp.]|nr:adenosylcobinamide-GDP ribazoletransferase [Brachymonas sp.]
MSDLLRTLLLALQFFTRIPLPAAWAQWADFSPARLRAAIACMPIVGWLVGGVAAAVFAAVLQLWGTPWMWRHAPGLLLALAALLSTAATIGLTGAMHEDGLADVADALLGSADAERALQIMKDPRVGSYAVLALVLALLLKTALLAVLALLNVQAALYLLLAAHVLSRFFPLLLVNRLPHVGLAGQSKTQQMAGVIDRIQLWPATLCCLPLVVVCWWLPQGPRLLLATGLCALAAGAVALGMGHWFKRRLQGFTGDCLGATQQVCELACYATALTVLLHLG